MLHTMNHVRKVFVGILPLVLLVPPSVVLSETVEWDDLVRTNGLYYKKFANVPFTGKVAASRDQGKIERGKKVGQWIHYRSDGRVEKTQNYSAGDLAGPTIKYSYYSNGQLKSRGAVRNGKGEGEWVGYHDNGQLFFIGFLKNGKKEGHWNFYDKDGTENLAGHLWFHQGTGLYRDDGKVSD